jgi:hypothetical protein
VRKGAAIFFSAMAVAYMAVRPASSARPMPSGAHALAARVAAHPADWRAASALAGIALDAPVRDPLALWHASSALAISLAPMQAEPRGDMAQSGFFHWNELSDADRKAVLDAYGPVMGDEGTFLRMYEAIYDLTADLDYLRRVQPRTAEATRALVWLAGTFGRFDQYRLLRGKENPDAAVVDKRDVSAEREIAITVKSVITDDVPPYIEVYVDKSLRAEGAVVGERTLTAPVERAAVHEIEVRLANPVTRNNTRRKVEVTAVRGI